MNISIFLHYHSKAWLFAFGLQNSLLGGCHCDTLYLAVNIYNHFSIWPVNVKLFTVFPAIISSEMWQRKWAHVTHRIWEASNENHCNLVSVLRRYTPIIIMHLDYFCVLQNILEWLLFLFLDILLVFSSLLFPFLMGVLWLLRE